MVFDLRIPLHVLSAGLSTGGESGGTGQGTHLGFDVVEGGRADDGEANEENVGLRIGQWSETVVILLSGRIPQTQADRSTIDHNTGGVVVKAEASQQELRQAMSDRDTNTVGIYSPGKAFVV